MQEWDRECLPWFFQLPCQESHRHEGIATCFAYSWILTKELCAPSSYVIVAKDIKIYIYFKCKYLKWKKRSFWSGRRSSTIIVNLQNSNTHDKPILFETNDEVIPSIWNFEGMCFFTKNWKYGLGLMFSLHTPQRHVQFVLGFFWEYVYQNKPETRY